MPKTVTQQASSDDAGGATKECAIVANGHVLREDMAFLGPNMFNFHPSNLNAKRLVNKDWCRDNFVLFKYMDRDQMQWSEEKGKFIVCSSAAQKECKMRNVAAFTQRMKQYLGNVLASVRNEFAKVVVGQFNKLGYTKKQTMPLVTLDDAI